MTVIGHNSFDFALSPNLKLFNTEYQGPICPCPQVAACCDEDGEGISDLDQDGIADGQDENPHNDEIQDLSDYLDGLPNTATNHFIPDWEVPTFTNQVKEPPSRAKENVRRNVLMTQIV